MALLQQTALEIAREMRLADFGRRAALEVQCTVAMAMAFSNNQWVSAGTGDRGGVAINGLAPRLGMSDDQIRVSLNQIRPRLRQACSRLMPSPEAFDYHVEAASAAQNDQLAARVGDARLNIYLRQSKAIRKLRRRVLYTATMGSAIVRRCINAREHGVILRDESGQPVIDPQTKQPRMLREFDHEWMVCPPYEFIRSQGANSPDFTGEDCVGHEKPITTDELYRRFGVKVTTTQTYGQLLDLQRMMQQWTGQKGGLGLEKVKRPAVMLQEWWFKGNDVDPFNPWPYYMVTYCDDRAAVEEDRTLKVLMFRKNPYRELPLHHFFYDPMPEMPWGQGLVEQVLQEQRLFNVAITGLLRTYLEQGGSKWVVYSGTFEGDIRTALSKRNSVITLNSPTAKPPARIEPPSIDQHCVMFAQGAQEYFDSALNQNPVQRGSVSKRGEAAAALQVRVEQSDSCNAARIDDDETTTNELLTGTLGDLATIAKLSPTGLKATFHMLGGQFDEPSIMCWMDQDWQLAACGVKVARDSMRPKTEKEWSDKYATNVRDQMIGAEQARIALMIRANEGMDPLEEMAWDKQASEIHSMASGQGTVEIAEGQNHRIHGIRLDMEMESPQWEQYPPEVKQAIIEHREEHRSMEVMNGQFGNMGANQQTGAGEQPSTQQIDIGPGGQDAAGGFNPQMQAASAPAGPGAPGQMGEAVTGPSSSYDSAEVAGY